MYKIIFIRHGKTQGNAERRYIGATDESLCPEGISQLKNNTYPEAGRIIASPMKRCVETAKIIYPGKNIETEYDMRECDFGIFEGKNYEELQGNIEYQRWIDSGGNIDFPGGESINAFKYRCTDAFERITSNNVENLSFVVHGGTIMAIMEKYDAKHKNYYDYQVKNGSGFICDYSDGKLINVTALMP